MIHVSLKRAWFTAVLLTVALLLCSFASGEGTADNLLYNGDFRLTDQDGMPDGWYTDAYIMTTGYTQFSLLDDADQEHGNAAEIHNFGLNDARFVQGVDVEPDTVYCLSGYIRASGVENGRGANLSVEGVYAFSESVYETNGEWEYIEYYGETGPDQDYIIVYARLGGYSGESTGQAWFRNISLRAVDRIPDNVIADRWYSVSSYSGSDDQDTNDEESRGETPAWPALIALSLAWAIILCVTIYYFRDGKRPSGSDLSVCGYQDERRMWFIPMLFLAFGIRIIVSYFTEGYMVDVNCFLSWGHTMASWGPGIFYQQTSFCDYPPLYTYVLGINSAIASALRTDTGWTRVVFRFFPALCDVVSCLILREAIRKKHGKTTIYTDLILIMMAFNPAAALNSAAWGQMDSVLCVMLLAVAVLAVEGGWKWAAAIPIYALSILVKPQALMLGILGAVYIVIAVVKEPERNLIPVLAGIAAGVAALAAGILPFGIRQQFGWLINKYAETLSSYPYATLNTANLYYLLGGNWSAITSSAHLAAPLFMAVFAACFGAVWYMQRKNRKKAWIEILCATVFSAWFILCAAMGFSWAFVGTGAMAFAFLISISFAVRKGNMSFLPYFGALLFILLYVFGIKMHERYLFPALFLLAAAWAMLRDRRILVLLALYTVTLFINEGIVLDNSMRLGSSLGHLNNDTAVLADILSILNIAGALYAVFLGFMMLKGASAREIRALPSFLPIRTLERMRSPLDYHPDRSLHWNARDTLILSGITIVFSAVSLLTLGSTRAPQSGWVSSGFDEQVVFDLGQYHEDIRILYFGQVSRYDFSFAQSDDGVTWSAETMAQMDQGQCWKWKYVTQSWENAQGTRDYYNSSQYIVHFRGRYIRVSAQQIGLRLNEIIFRSADGTPIPCTVSARFGGNEESELYSDPAALIDEQDTLEDVPHLFCGSSGITEAEPSWWNSTYFDEIYHARTGMEFLEGSVPYETSHPPLGKILISCGIAIFGMTPFGWRFAGAMAGILMLPGIYLLAKQMTKRTWLAAIGCSLMALDCMHLTQTQIATIDSFPVLFIIFAYFFMLRYMQTDIVKLPLRSSLIPLAFSGLFMGLSVASKWIGIYAGIGLAVLFAWHGIRHIRINTEAVRMFAGPDLREKEKAELAPYIADEQGRLHPERYRLAVISAWCLLFFVAVPLVIYLTSYIPYMAYNHQIRSIGDYLSAVWKAQQGMLSYHSTPGLGMDHPFYSPWYEWPVIGKPMYYATESYHAADAAVRHSIFCFGNPAVWWGGLGAIVICLIRWIAEKHYTEPGKDVRWHLISSNRNGLFGYIFIAIMAQYLPWVLVPRGTYIYHYFASVPFLIMTFCLCFSGWKKNRRMLYTAAGGVLVAAAVCFFIILFPYASGVTVPTAWLDLGKRILHIYY